MTIKRTLADVFAYVTEPMNETKWHKEVVDVRRTFEGSVGAGSTFEWNINFMGAHQVQLEVKEFVPAGAK